MTCNCKHAGKQDTRWDFGRARRNKGQPWYRVFSEPKTVSQRPRPKVVSNTPPPKTIVRFVIGVSVGKK